MTSLRKQAVSWFFAISALAISVIGGSFVFLNNEIPTDPGYIGTHLEKSRHFNVSLAKKDGYSHEEITEYIVKINKAEFARKWHRLLSIVASLYIVSVLGIVAITLRKEATHSAQLE